MRLNFPLLLAALTFLLVSILVTRSCTSNKVLDRIDPLVDQISHSIDSVKQVSDRKTEYITQLESRVADSNNALAKADLKVIELERKLENLESRMKSKAYDGPVFSRDTEADELRAVLVSMTDLPERDIPEEVTDVVTEEVVEKPIDPIPISYDVIPPSPRRYKLFRSTEFGASVGMGMNFSNGSSSVLGGIHMKTGNVIFGANYLFGENIATFQVGWNF